MLLVSDPGAEPRTVEVHGQPFELRPCVGRAPLRGTYVDGNEANGDDRPQGFLVAQPPASVTPPHFHETAQFQVFVGGDGRLGKRALHPLAVQFAGPHTPYGPIAAGPTGIRYFTLRRRWDPGAKYLPARRDRFVRGRQRQRVVDDAPPGEAARALAAGAVVERVLLRESDGLCIARLGAGAGAAVDAPAQARAGGCYLVVLAGELILGGRALPALATVFAAPGDGWPGARAGAGGADLLRLAFPAGA